MNRATYVRVRATTQARKEKIVFENNMYYISVTMKAERGLANARIKELLAQAVSCNPKQLRLVKGGTSPSKTFLLVNT